MQRDANKVASFEMRLRLPSVAINDFLHPIEAGFGGLKADGHNARFPLIL